MLNFKQDVALLYDKFSDAKAWDKRNLLQERVGKQHINQWRPEQNTLFRNLPLHQAIGSAKVHVRFHHLTAPESVLLLKVLNWLQEDKSNQNIPQSTHLYWKSSSVAANGDTRIKMWWLSEINMQHFYFNPPGNLNSNISRRKILIVFGSKYLRTSLFVHEFRKRRFVSDILMNTLALWYKFML